MRCRPSVRVFLDPRLREHKTPLEVRRLNELKRFTEQFSQDPHSGPALLDARQVTLAKQRADASFWMSCAGTLAAGALAVWAYAGLARVVRSAGVAREQP